MKRQRNETEKFSKDPIENIIRVSNGGQMDGYLKVAHNFKESFFITGSGRYITKAISLSQMLDKDKYEIKTTKVHRCKIKPSTPAISIECRFTGKIKKLEDL